MNKLVLFLLLISSLLFTACGSGQSWEKEEETIEVSNRIISDDVNVEWELVEKQASDEETLIRLKISYNGIPIQDFDVNHEKLLHLIIVSEDLSYFNHIHPEYLGDGVFEITNQFPAGGKYRMVADFKPTDGSSVSKLEWINVKGKVAEPVPINVDNVFERVVDKKHVSMSIEPQIEAGKELTMKFSLTDEITRQPISNLEPYLGSIGHVVVLSEDGERYLHVHALENQGTGPDALFETEFPESGVYKVWGQFQKDGQVFTVSYVVKVP
ncbi:hypothetical protein ACFYKX_07670 [Cytobacillus sp. FJAT-54145]|uniref:YtkA-like domain-containing protein n=1 Tax=Cytobacillus spartinae TaxID=3299023 RepID=A0ABW6K8G8_9BACI